MVIAEILAGGLYKSFLDYLILSQRPHPGPLQTLPLWYSDALRGVVGEEHQQRRERGF